MAKLTHLSITALKDTRITTAVKKIKYLDRSNGKADRPEGQQDYDEQTHGLVLSADQELEIDVRDEQLPYFQAAVNAGDVVIAGMEKQPIAKGKEVR